MMNITCPTCGFSSAIGDERLPADSFQARCPRCRDSFPVTRGMAVALAAPAADAVQAPEGIECPKCSARQAPGEICVRCGVVFRKFRPAEAHIAGTPIIPVPPPADASEVAVEESGWVNIVNIIALLFLLDSTLSLIMRVPGLAGVIASQNGMSFHQKAKYLYDVLMAAGLFVTSFGLSMRKGWARLAMTALLSLGLAEGLYMLTYQHVAIAELERNLQENFSELKRNNTAKWVGCLVYLYFIFMLNTPGIKARFR
ncbi:MAG: zinc-ribbon domain-containing protein [Geobacteraceae bacterium]|nr:zinc-ribbon domain-containing protein [Geobacteraceae bacterium]